MNNTICNGIEATGNIIMKIFIAIAAIIITCLIILPSIAFFLGLLYYAKEAASLVIEILGEILSIFT